MCAVGGENAAEHHGVHLAVAGERRCRGTVGKRHRVAHARLAHRFDGGGDIADLARTQPVARIEPAGAHMPDLDDIKGRAGRHHADAVTGADDALLDADIDDDAAVAVIIAVENERPEGFFIVARGGGNVPDDRFEHRLDVDTVLGGDERRIGRIDADNILNFPLHRLGVCGGQVDLVDDRHDLQPVLHRKIGVGKRLRLNTLRSVHHQKRALARRQRAGHLVVKVHMPGGVDEIEFIVLAVVGMIGHGDGVRLDGDAALPFEIHAVEQLILHVPQSDRARFFEDAVGERGLAVVDMGDDAEISGVLS